MLHYHSGHSAIVADLRYKHSIRVLKSDSRLFLIKNFDGEALPWGFLSGALLPLAPTLNRGLLAAVLPPVLNIIKLFSDGNLKVRLPPII